MIDMKQTLVYAFALLQFLAFVAKAEDHPEYYVDKGACPFECCTYRDWATEVGTPLHSKPNPGSSVIGSALEGERVHALTGEVHTKPGKLVVSRVTDPFDKGDVLWVYTYVGEGFYKIWYQGKFIEEQIDFSWRNPGSEDCGAFELLPESVWWVKVKTHHGLEGWTNKPENFSNKDACG